MPPFIKHIHRQKKNHVNVKKTLLGGVRLPPEDEHELMYRDKYLETLQGKKPLLSDLERQLGMIRTKNAYTQALKR